MSRPEGIKRRPSAIELAEKLTYGAVVVNIYILNVYMGTGPIALPFGFQTGGVLLSSLFLVFVAFVAYITATFIVETLVIANLLLRFRGDIGEVGAAGAQIHQRASHNFASPSVLRTHSQTPVFEMVPAANNQKKRVFRALDSSVWDIEKRIEIGELSEIFFSACACACCRCCSTRCLR